IPDKCIAREIKGAVVFSPDGNSVDVDYGKGYILERRMYDRWLAEEAARAGAHLRAKSPVNDIIKKDNYVKGVKGNFDGNEFKNESKIVVDASGVESKIARKAGIKNSIEPVNIDSGFQYEMVDLDLQDSHKIELYFGNDIAPRGYIWIFPKGKDKANVGIGIGGGNYEKTAKKYLDAWIESKPNIRRGSITSVISGGIPVGGFLDNMVTNGLMAVGDAAHQVNPIHGGGLKEATIAGQLAGKTIIEAFEENNFSEDFLSKYNEEWWNERGEKLKKVQKIREVVEKLSNKDLNLLAKNLSGEEMISFTRGNKLGNLAKILMKKPSLISLARHLI
ncbi:MAG: NAD(P)/FAD-dependent oxidoreductase, partial [Candidatus Aenigmatarchaeota archaeon]